jgi:PAS domain S-box-containing protein
MRTRLRLLLMEDCSKDAILIVRELQQAGLDFTHQRVETLDEVKAALEVETWDFIICDYCLRGFDGLAVLALYGQLGLDIPFIMVSGRMGEDRAVEFLKAGAHEYVIKENLARLAPAVGRELQAAQARRVRRNTETVKEFQASVVESCNDAITGKTLDGTVLSWNAAAEWIYGYTAAEMIGRSVSVLIPSYRPDEFAEMIEKLTRGERVQDFETVRVRKDGATVEVSLTISPIKDACACIIGVSTVARDITQRKKDETERLSLIQDLTAALATKVGCLGRA